MIRFFWSPNLLYCLLLMMGTPLHADVYKMIGRNGQVIFTDKPEGSGYHLVIKSNRPALLAGLEALQGTLFLGMGRALLPCRISERRDHSGGGVNSSMPVWLSGRLRPMALTLGSYMPSFRRNLLITLKRFPTRGLRVSCS